MTITVKVKKLQEDAFIPAKAYVEDAGFDLHALENVVIAPGETVKVRTGLAFEVPVGYEMQVRPRSGVSLRTSLRVILGTVDSQYRGEVGVIVDNDSRDEWSNASRKLDNTYDAETLNKSRGYVIHKGDRIAQAVIQKIPTINLVEVDELSHSDRGENGFGSTGV